MQMARRIEEDYGDMMQKRTPEERVAQMTQHSTEEEVMQLHGMTLAEYRVKLREYYESQLQSRGDGTIMLPGI
jgi:hypothetical protein